MNHSDEGFVSLFNGRDLTGWFATPRSYGALWAGGPTVADVAPGLLPDDCDEQAARATYGDFELIVEANAARGHIAFEVHDNDTRFWGAAMGSPRMVPLAEHRHQGVVTTGGDRSVCS